MLTLTTFIQHSIGIPSYSKPKRKIKGIQTGMAEVKCHCLQSHHSIDVFSHSVVSDSATPWTVNHQAPLSIELSRQE